MIKTLDTVQVQNRINKYFDTFQEINAEGRKFSIMPTRSDVPLIQRISYDPQADLFEIVFEHKEAIKNDRRGNVEFMEDSNNRLIGIRLYNIRQESITQISLIISTLDDVIAQARVGLGSSPTLKGVAEISIEQRKIDFFKNIIEEELPQLVG